MSFDLEEAAEPSIDESKCTGCGLCAKICPTGTLAMRKGRPKPGRRTFMPCIACGQCMAVCPDEAVTVRGRSLSPDDMAPLPPERASAASLDALLLSRRSVRSFADEPVARADVDRILAMTSTAPMGIPPSGVGVVVFHGRDKVRLFAADAVGCFRGLDWMFNPLVLAAMRPFIGRHDHAAMRDFVKPLLREIVGRWDAGHDVFAYDAPLALLFHRSPSSDPADAHIAATYAMVAAQSLGLGTCLLGTVAALDHDKGFRRKHGVPAEDRFGLALLAGHPSVSFRRGIRRKLASVRFA